MTTPERPVLKAWTLVPVSMMTEFKAGVSGANQPLVSLERAILWMTVVYLSREQRCTATNRGRKVSSVLPQSETSILCLEEESNPRLRSDSASVVPRVLLASATLVLRTQESTSLLLTRSLLWVCVPSAPRLYEKIPWKSSSGLKRSGQSTIANGR